MAICDFNDNESKRVEVNTYNSFPDIMDIAILYNNIAVLLSSLLTTHETHMSNGLRPRREYNISGLFAFFHLRDYIARVWSYRGGF